MIAHHIDPARGIIATRAAGKVTLLDLAAYLARLMADAKFSADYDALIVALDVEATAPATSVGTFGPIFRAWSKRRAGVRWAFVLPNVETKTLVESALLKAKLGNVETKCFLSEGAAFAWLEAARSSPLRE
jgi:hypothetical protein